ncbi:hypothetical protein [Moorena bouillonii]|uniref:Uncharacterized protein n=1 Tax=Moorena bouillonii PNG TaxID=568701 RepID=A0A1U7N157_9CYAN|nr:hypothetical protein [Moorena bouillonii]OLT59688.1 hypothetical protein BJP37_12250 [Moorena bouillonii PNG]
MSSVGEAFIQGIGRPDLPEVSGIDFSKRIAQKVWEEVQEEIGSGWFMNRFLYLFGEKLEYLSPCIDAWSFLLDSELNRIVIGKNAYGFLLIMEDPKTKGINAPIGLFDPWNISYRKYDGLGFINLIGNWLPQGRVPGFLYNILYESWQEKNKNYLDFFEIIAIKQPLSLGGKIEEQNFQIENIVEYYQTTGSIYNKVLNS